MEGRIDDGDYEEGVEGGYGKGGGGREGVDGNHWRGAWVWFLGEEEEKGGGLGGVVVVSGL